MNPYREPLGINAPNLRRLVDHPEANPYSMLIATLLEAGHPMTLDAVSERLAEVGFGERAAVLEALSRCRPERLPVVRDAERYGLDPRHDELDLWASRLGLLPRLPQHPPRPRAQPQSVEDDAATTSRDEVRQRLHHLGPFALHLILERMVDCLPLRELHALVEGSLRVDRIASEAPLDTRLERQTRETLDGTFRGELVLDAPHGQRAPRETWIWLARTTHLLELAIAALPQHPHLAPATEALLDAVREVDADPDRYIVFEDDDCASLHLEPTIKAGRRAVRQAQTGQ